MSIRARIRLQPHGLRETRVALRPGRSAAPTACACSGCILCAAGCERASMHGNIYCKGCAHAGVIAA